MDVLLTDGDRRWSLEDTTHWVRKRLNPHFAPQPLDGRKVRVRYSDTNYLLLIGIIEHCRQAPYHEALQNLILDRSEERRVGKECRSRGAPYHEKKQRQ